jgi:hypothetical protein
VDQKQLLKWSKKAITLEAVGKYNKIAITTLA